MPKQSKPPKLSKTEQELKTLRGKYETAMLLFDSIPDPVFTVDEQMRITSFNRAAAELSGFSAKEAQGKKCQQIFQSNRWNGTCMLKQCIKERKILVGEELKLKNAQGKEIDAVANAAAIIDATGKLLGGIEIIRDISAELEKQRKLLEQHVRLDEYHQTSMNLALAVSECFQVLEQAKSGNLEARVSPETLASDDELMAGLGKALNNTLEHLQNQHMRVDEYHEMSMNLAISLSECFQVLMDVRHGKLDTRVSESVTKSDDELMSSLGKAINDTIETQAELIQRQQYAIKELATTVNYFTIERRGAPLF